MRQQLPRPRNPRLDLVADHQHVVLVAELADAAEVGVVWDYDARFALDRLDYESREFLPVRGECFLCRFDVVVGEHFLRAGTHGPDVGEVGAVVLAAFGVGAHGDGGEGAAVEVLLHAEDEGFILWDLLDFVPPLPCDLDACLDRFGARVHREHHVEAHHGGHLLGELWEDIVVEGAAAEGDARGLLDQGLDQFRVAVALVDGGVGGEEVEVLFAFGVPDGAAGGFGEDDGERVVVVCGVGCFGRHGLLRRGGMVGSGLLGGREGGCLCVETGVRVAVGLLVNGDWRHGGLDS